MQRDFQAEGVAADQAPAAAPPRSGEFVTVLLLAIGCGLVGLDRFIISPLFPVMARDLHLNYQDLGLISGVLALTWGLSSVFTGQLSDRIGRKRVLIPAVLVFSLLVGFTGLATGLGTLLLFRAIMGVAEGAFMPTCIAATVDVSKRHRVGRNVGITQMAVGAVGLGLGPVIALQMLKVVPSWHWVFGIVAVPGLLLALLMRRGIHEVPRARPAASAARSAPLREALSHGNVVAITLASMCWFTSMVVIAAFLPTYLTDHLKLGMDAMGFVLSGAGIGSIFGMVGLPWLSDKLGRKKVIVASLILELVCLLLLRRTGAEPSMLFAFVLLAYLFNTGAMAIGIGPLASEAVPPHLASTAIGLVLGTGEMIGGAVMPAVTGALADRLGIDVILTVSLVAVAAAAAVMLVFVRKRSKPAGADAASVAPY